MSVRCGKYRKILRVLWLSKTILKVNYEERTPLYFVKKQNTGVIALKCI